MKRKVILIVIYCFCGEILSQTAPTRDTIKIKINQESTEVLVPESGKKTTVIFEDSMNMIQVSILKMNKRNPIVKEYFEPEKNWIKKDWSSNRQRKWFNEIELGFLIGNFRKLEERSYFYHTSLDSNSTAIMQEFYNYTVPVVGNYLRLAVTEKSRPILKNLLDFKAGYCYSLDYLVSKGSGKYHSIWSGEKYEGIAYQYNYFHSVTIPLGLCMQFRKSTYLDKAEIGIRAGFYLQHKSGRFATDSGILYKIYNPNIGFKQVFQLYSKWYYKNFFIAISSDLSTRKFGHAYHEKSFITSEKTYNIQANGIFNKYWQFGFGVKVKL